MSPFIYGLIIGLIIGWIIEWVIDLLFWRRDDARLQQKLVAAQEKNQSLQTQLEECKSRQTQMVRANGDLQHCQQELVDAENTIDQLRAQLNELAAKIPTEKDRLERVKGIGAVFAKRLNEAGIHTFAELAQQSPQKVREIIDPEEWQKIEPESWVAQAKTLADQKSSAKEA